MSTISNAVQVMVDDLVAKMASDAPLTAEEQSMVAEAIALLSKSTKLETALIAVAEKHLGTATSALDSAKVSLQENANYLKLLPQINEIKTSFGQIQTDFNQTLGSLGSVMREGAPATPALDFSYFGADVYTLNSYEKLNSTTQPVRVSYLFNTSPSTVTSLFDEDEKCFYVYLGYRKIGNYDLAPSYDVALKIDATGKKVLNQTSVRLSASDSVSLLLVKTSEGVRLAQLSETGLQLFEVMPSMNKLSDVIPVSGGAFYQDPDSLNIWSYSGGRAQYSVWNESSGSYQTSPDNTHDFLVEANFNDWAEQKGYSRLDMSMGSPGSTTRYPLKAIVDSLITSTPSYRMFHGKNMSHSASMSVIKGQYISHSLGDTYYHAVNSSLTVYGAKCHCVFEDKAANFSLSMSGHADFSAYNEDPDEHRTFDTFYAPTVLAISPYHRIAVLAMAQCLQKENSSYKGYLDYRKTVLRAF